MLQPSVDFTLALAHQSSFSGPWEIWMHSPPNQIAVLWIEQSSLTQTLFIVVIIIATMTANLSQALLTPVSCSVESIYNSGAIWPIPSTPWQRNSQSRIENVSPCLSPFWVSSPIPLLSCKDSMRATLFVFQYIQGLWQSYTPFWPTGTQGLC